MLNNIGTTKDCSNLQQPFDAAVVIQTVWRPSLMQSVRSVFAQEGVGRIQVLIGVDLAQGDPGILELIRSECPGHVALTVIDPGYSTSQRHGSLYPNHYGGAMRTVLSYLANSRFVSYLDDDNWYAPQHLSSLLAAINGRAWAFSLRTFVHSGLEEITCKDTWESLGPGKGAYAESSGGFVDTNCFMIDKIACHGILPGWCLAKFVDGTGEDRVIFDYLKNKPHGATNQHTVFYRKKLDAENPHMLREYEKAGIDLARLVPSAKLPL